MAVGFKLDMKTLRKKHGKMIISMAYGFLWVKNLEVRVLKDERKDRWWSETRVFDIIKQQ